MTLEDFGNELFRIADELEDLRISCYPLLKEEDFGEVDNDQLFSLQSKIRDIAKIYYPNNY